MVRARDRTLKRLLRRPPVRRLLEEHIERAGAGHVITDLEGQAVVGDPQAVSGQAEPLMADAVMIGHAYGPRRRELAEIIGVLAELEGETRAVANESLQRYRELTMLYEISERIISAPDPVSVAAAKRRNAT